MEEAREALADPQAEVHLQVSAAPGPCCPLLLVVNCLAWHGGYVNDCPAIAMDGKKGPEPPCVQVADIEASQADHCKLYIHTKLNNITYRMKAETT